MNKYAQLTLSEASTLMVLHDDVDITAHLDGITQPSGYTEVREQVLEPATCEELIKEFELLMMED